MKNGPGRGRPNRNNILAHKDLERLNANPIEMLVEVYREAMAAYKSARGYSDKMDAGAQYLAVAGKAATDLAKFKHPTLSAIAVKDMSNDSERAALNTQQAIDIIKSDPFAKEIKTDDIISAMQSNLHAPSLPFSAIKTGKNDDEI